MKWQDLAKKSGWLFQVFIFLPLGKHYGIGVIRKTEITRRKKCSSSLGDRHKIGR